MFVSNQFIYFHRDMRQALQKRIRDAVKEFGASVTGIQSEEFEDWRIIKEDQIDKAEDETKGIIFNILQQNFMNCILIFLEANSPAIRVKKKKQFDIHKHMQKDQKTITDAEWEELKDVFS